jgi:fermentation-respiration switch protein FrsA (DUF1100 family)
MSRIWMGGAETLIGPRGRGEADVFTPPAEMRRLFEAFAGPKSLWLAPGLGHNGVSTTTRQDYRDHLLAFLRGAIGVP